jgi:hypothetical protein
VEGEYFYFNNPQVHSAHLKDAQKWLADHPEVAINFLTGYSKHVKQPWLSGNNGISKLPNDRCLDSKRMLNCSVWRFGCNTLSSTVRSVLPHIDYSASVHVAVLLSVFAKISHMNVIRQRTET